MKTWRELLITTDFVDFAWKYARAISQTKKEILDKIKDDPSNFFKYVTPSDLAWTLMVYFNNKRKWKADILLAKKKAEEETAKRAATSNKKRKTASKKQASADDDEVDVPDVVRQRWSGTKKITGGGDGYSAEGKKFYKKMCWVFGKKIELDEWKDVWAEYWKEEESNYIVSRKKDKPIWNMFEESNEGDGNCDLFSDDDEDFTDEDHSNESGMMEAV